MGQNINQNCFLSHLVLGKLEVGSKIILRAWEVPEDPKTPHLELFHGQFCYFWVPFLTVRWFLGFYFGSYFQLPESQRVLGIILVDFYHPPWAEKKGLESGETCCGVAWDEVFWELLAFLHLKMILEPIFCFLGARWLKKIWLVFTTLPSWEKGPGKLQNLPCTMTSGAFLGLLAFFSPQDYFVPIFCFPGTR